MMKDIFVLHFLLSSSCFFSQDVKPNKKIKSDTNFIHEVSGISAPKSLGELSRSDLKTNSKNDSIFSAEYLNSKSNVNYSFSIYPGALDEERLINFYIKSLGDKRFSPKELDSKLVFVKNENFKMNGLSGFYKHLNNWINYRVYDAGFFVFVSELSQKDGDTIELKNKHDQFINELVPTKIIEKNPITRFSNIHYAPAAFRDSLMLRSTMSSSMNKMKWIFENINKYERAAGIPGLYLDYQIAGINGFIDYTSEKNPKPSKGGTQTNKILAFFKKLRDDDFLDEYLMESYEYLLIAPADTKFDYVGYQNWKTYNSMDFDMNKKYYLIVNSRKKTDLSKDE